MNTATKNTTTKTYGVRRLKPVFTGALTCLMLVSFGTKNLGAANLSKGFELHTGLLGEKREYLFDLNLYDFGGSHLRASLNLNQFISLGVGAYADGVIGSSDLEFYVPGVYVKIRLTDNPAESWNLAFGYDLFQIGSFYTGTDRDYGLFGVLSKGFVLVSGSPSVVSLGVYYPVIPDQETAVAGASVIASASEFFALTIEMAELGFHEGRTFNFLNNWSMGFNLNEQMTLSFVFQIAAMNRDSNDIPDSKSAFRYSRSIRFVYNNFY